MNYRHIYHAGNFADVFKHALLVALIEPLKKKEKPFCVVDTHAGVGAYDLTSLEAEKTLEHEDGIDRLLAARPRHPALARYAEVVRAGYPPVYPGSPAIAAELLRDQDRLVLNELHPDDCARLRRAFSRDARVHVHEGDGYQALKALLPPKERRGLVLVDPPFEEDGELARMEAGLREASKRFATGTLAFWYPIKDRGAVNHFCSRVVASGAREVLVLELEVGGDPAERLDACGLLVVRPPYGFEAEARGVLAELTPILARDRRARSSVRVLVPE